MKLNHFQLAEVKSHIDEELVWIIDETVEVFKNDPKKVVDGVWYPWALYQCVGKVIADVIAEREGCPNHYTYRLYRDEAASILFDAYRTSYPNKGFKWSNMSEWMYIGDGLEQLIATALLRTRAPIVEYTDTYWPFGNAGGFCNPMKLKMMED